MTGFVSSICSRAEKKEKQKQHNVDQASNGCQEKHNTDHITHLVRVGLWQNMGASSVSRLRLMAWDGLLQDYHCSWLS